MWMNATLKIDIRGVLTVVKKKHSNQKIFLKDFSQKLKQISMWLCKA